MPLVNIPGVGQVNFPDTMNDEQILAAIRNNILPRYGNRQPEVAPPPEPRGSNMGLAGDALGSLISGAGGVGTAIGGLTGLATGNYNTGITRLGRRAQEYGESFMSPELLASRERLDREVKEASERGMLAEAGAAARGVLSDPRLLGSFVFEQVPQVVGSLGVGRAAGAVGQYAGRRAGSEAAAATGRTAAVGTAIGTGTALQTGEVANSTYQDVMNLAPEVIERSPGYQELRRTLTDQEARESLANRAAREAAAIAAPISAGTAALFGAERFALGDQIKRRAISRIVLGFTGEAAQELLEEGGGKFAQNVGARRADVDRDLSQGVAGAAAQGAIVGGIIGGGTGLVSGRAPGPRGEDVDLRRALDPYLASTERGGPGPSVDEVADLARVVSDRLLGVTAEQFMAATPRDRDILIARAQREADGRQAEYGPMPMGNDGRVLRQKPEANSDAITQSGSPPSDETIYGQAGSRAQSVRFEDERGEVMDDGRTQAEFFRARAEEQARQSAAFPPSTASEDLFRGVRDTQIVPPGTSAEQTVDAASNTRATKEPVGAFNPLVENFINLHVSAYGSEQPISIPAFQQYASDTLGATVTLNQAKEIFDTYYNASTKGQIPAGQGFVLQREEVSKQTTEGRPIGNDGERMPPLVSFGAEAQEQTVYRAIPSAPRSAGTDPDGRPLPQPDPPAPFPRAREAIWANADNDIPVTVLPDAPNAGPGDRLYQKVSYQGRESFVPFDQLRFSEKAQPPSRSSPAPVRASPLGFADERLREMSARDPGNQAPDAQPGQATQTTQSPQTQAPQKDKALDRAREVVADRLDKLSKRGPQGKRARAAIEKAIQDGRFDAGQIYAAFIAGEKIASLLPAGASHDIRFVDLLTADKKAAKASGNKNAEEAQGNRAPPTGSINEARFQQLMREGLTADRAYAMVQSDAVNGIISISLSPTQLPFVRETALHEAYHVLQDYYGKYDVQFAKLMSRGFRDDMMIAEVDPTIRRKLEKIRVPGRGISYWQQLTGTLPDILTAREAQAYVFAALTDAANRGTPMTGLKPAFARFVSFLRQFSTRMGNTLRGDGFQTVEDLMGRVAQGDARRFDDRATPTNQDFPERTAGVELSARTTEALIRNATPSDIAGKQFDIQYTRVSDLMERGLRKIPFVGKKVKDTTTEDLIIKYQDRMLPLGRMVDVVKKSGGTVVDASDIYMTEELYHGRVGTAVDERDKRLYTPVFDAMKRLNLTTNDVDDYLEARHAPERNAFVRSINEDPSKGAGITDQQAASTMQRLAPQKTKLDEVAKLVDAIIADTNKTRSETGLTPDYSKLNNQTNFKHYVPLRGFADEDVFDDKGVEGLRARTGQGFKIKGKEDRSITGRRSRAANILGHVILQNEETVIRSEKNKVGQALLKLVRDNPQQTEGFAKILESAPVEPRVVNGKVKLVASGMYKNRDDVMVVKEGGNEVAVEIYDERLAKALTGATGLGAENTSVILRALGTFNRYLAQVNTTLNPEFLISNFAGDLQTANINIKQYDAKGMGRKIISDVASALAGARAVIRDGDTNTKWAKAFEDFRKAGGTTEYLGLRDIDSKIEKINREIAGNKGPLVLQPFKSLIKIIEDYNSVAENAIRLSTFQNLRDMGVSDAKAAQVAKNLTVNFNKGGENRVLMNSLYLFYNASIQGSMAMVNAMARSPRVRKYVAGIITAGLMHDVINAMMSGMDEDERKVYDKIPDHVLARNYVLMDPFGITERGYFGFPMPYGFNAFFNMGRNLARVSRGEGDPMKAGTSILMGFAEAFNPIGGTQSFINLVSPTITDPLVELATNRNFASRPISPDERSFGPPTPDSQRFWSNTFPPYVTVAQWLNQITGGTNVIPGSVDISPNTIGYLVNYATGAAGAFAERVAKFGFSTVPNALTGDLENFEVRDVPFVRKLYGNVTRRNDLESFIESSNRITQIQREFKEAERFGQAERMEQVMRDYPRELAVAPIIEDLIRERRKITREINLIRRDPNIDDQSRRELLRSLGQQADFFVGQVNQVYNTQVRR